MHPYGIETYTYDGVILSRAEPVNLTVAPGCPVTAEDPVTERFTSKERDAETGLDFFGERYFSSAQGRFTSADKPFADQNTSDPQSWNLYTYVRNNPLKLVDVQGSQAAQAIQQQLQQTYNAAPPGPIKLAAGITLGVATIAIVAPDAGRAIGDFVRSLPDSTPSVSTGAPPSLDTMIKGDLSSIFTFPGSTQGVDNSPIESRGFSPGVKADTDAKAGGLCEYCGTVVIPGQKSQPGVTPSANERQTDHYEPY